MIQVLRSEDIVEMAKDAARYRFLRLEPTDAGFYCFTPEEMDAAIDAMLKEQE